MNIFNTKKQENWLREPKGTFEKSCIDYFIDFCMEVVK